MNLNIWVYTRSAEILGIQENSKCNNDHKEIQTENRNTKKKNKKYMEHTFMEYN